jgi:CysZ protein
MDPATSHPSSRLSLRRVGIEPWPAARNPVLSFAQGAGLLPRGAAFLIRRPSLWGLVAAPLILNTLLFAGLIVWGFGDFSEFLRQHAGERSGWLWVGVGAVARLAFWVAVLVVVYLIFTPAALLIAAPFNDRLAEHAERACGLAAPEGRGPLWLSMIGEAVYALVCEMKRLVFFAAVFGLLFALNVVPVFGAFLFMIGGLWWACWAAALEFAGYAAERRRLSLRAAWSLLRRRRWRACGFGAAAACLLLVPFLNALATPLCAVGGTFLFAMAEHERVDEEGESV